jgi:hypothetical protein
MSQPAPFAVCECFLKRTHGNVFENLRTELGILLPAENTVALEGMHSAAAARAFGSFLSNTACSKIVSKIAHLYPPKMQFSIQKFPGLVQGIFK